MADERLEFTVVADDKASKALVAIGKRIDAITKVLAKFDKQLKGVSTGFAAAEKAAAATTEAVKEVTKQADKAGDKISSAAKKLAVKPGNEGIFGGVLKGTLAADAIKGVLTTVAHVAAQVAVKVGELGLQFTASAVHASTFRVQAEKALTALRHGESGEEQFKRIRAVVGEFGTDLEETTKQFQHLAAMQFPEDMALQIFKRGQDLIAAGSSTEQIEAAITAITQIQAAGKINGQDLMQLANAGVSIQLIYEQLAVNMGKTVDEVKKLKEAGKIDAGTGIQAILDAIGKKVNAPNAGDAAKKLIQPIAFARAQWDLLLDDIGVAIRPAIDAANAAISDFLAYLKTSEGRDMLRSIQEAFSDIAQKAKELIGDIDLKEIVKSVVDFGLGFKEAFAGKAIPEINNFINTLLRLAGVESDATPEEMGAGLAEKIGDIARFATIIAETLPVILKILAAIGAVYAVGAAVAFVLGLIGGVGATIAALPFVIAAGIVGAGYLIYKYWDDIKAAFTKAWDWFINLEAQWIGWWVDLGKNIISGLIRGILGGIELVKSAVSSVVGGIKGVFTGELDIHSPSRLFHKYGKFLPQGTAGGVKEDAPILHKAVADMAAIPPPRLGDQITKSIDNSTSSRVQIQNSQQFNLQAASSAQAGAVANDIAGIGAGALQAAFGA